MKIFVWAYRWTLKKHWAVQTLITYSPAFFEVSINKTDGFTINSKAYSVWLKKRMDDRERLVFGVICCKEWKFWRMRASNSHWLSQILGLLSVAKSRRSQNLNISAKASCEMHAQPVVSILKKSLLVIHDHYDQQLRSIVLSSFVRDKRNFTKFPLCVYLQVTLCKTEHLKFNWKIVSKVIDRLGRQDSVLEETSYCPTYSLSMISPVVQLCMSMI